MKNNAKTMLVVVAIAAAVIVGSFCLLKWVDAPSDNNEPYTNSLSHSICITQEEAETDWSTAGTSVSGGVREGNSQSDILTENGELNTEKISQQGPQDSRYNRNPETERHPLPKPIWPPESESTTIPIIRDYSYNQELSKQVGNSIIQVLRPDGGLKLEPYKDFHTPDKYLGEKTIPQFVNAHEILTHIDSGDPATQIVDRWLDAFEVTSDVNMISVTIYEIEGGYYYGFSAYYFPY